MLNHEARVLKYVTTLCFPSSFKVVTNFTNDSDVTGENPNCSSDLTIMLFSLYTKWKRYNINVCFKFYDVEVKFTIPSVYSIAKPMRRFYIHKSFTRESLFVCMFTKP
jgi:hypothetical protein